MIWFRKYLDTDPFIKQASGNKYLPGRIGEPLGTNCLTMAGAYSMLKWCKD